MLGRANNQYRASRPPPNNNAPLAKQLFPSSSPSTQDGNIIQSFKNGRDKGQPRPNSTATTSSTLGASATPLSSSSSNLMRPYMRTDSPTSNTSYGSNSVASLCKNAGSFAEELPIMASTGGLDSKPHPSVYISVDDFSDDDNLELDYQCHDSLPSMPPVAKAPAQAIADPPPAISAAPSSTQFTWSSSPQEHKVPPPANRTFHSSNRTGNTLKRQPLEDSAPSRPAATIKRARLPPSFTRKSKPEVIDEDAIYEASRAQEPEPFATPAPNPKKTQLWDITQSAYKEKQEKFKAANKKSEPETGPSATETHAKSKANASAISLSSEQQQVIDMVLKNKQSVFFTGPAGTGKSVLMRAIIQELKKKCAKDPERISVTASTGLAACNIGGMTLHSFAGIGLGKEDVPTLVRKIRRNPKAKNRWLRTNTLVIDEVSMVDGDLFDKLAQIARTIRNNGRPWGGIQLVITGDFFQLPPVPDGGGKKDIKFAFEAATWNTSIDHTIGLTQVFRQKDPGFATMLNEMRLGRISDKTVQTFKNLSRPLNLEDGLTATELFPTRFEVDRSNDSRLKVLSGDVRRFEATDTGDPNIRDKLLQHMMAPKTMDLKKGAQVMLIKNLDETLVNGSLGKVIGFSSEAAFAYATSKNAEPDEEVDVDPRTKAKIASFSRDMGSLKDLKEYPIVQFTATDGTHRSLLVVPEDWKVELPNGEVQAQRRQLPLILAWALSIHKAQGQTLERVKVDLGKVFEKGQAYVALSRATSQQGLQVLRFDKNKVLAHPRVVGFYNKLYSADTAIKPRKPNTISDFASQSSNASFRGKGPSRQVTDLDDDEEAMAAAYG